MLSFNSRSEKLQGLLLLSLIALFVSTFYNRYIQSDENWVFEQAYWLVNEGEVKLKSIPGIFNWDTYFLAYHKFFVWFTAGIYMLFGAQLYAYKIFILIIFVFTIIIVTRYYLKNTGDKKLRFLPAILFISTPVMIVKGFELRPEPVVMLIGFMSFVFLEKKRKNNSFINILIAGLLAGLAFLTHLNGLIFCITGFFYLVYYRQLQSLIIFTVAGFLIGALYFIHMLDPFMLNEWMHNLKNWPSHEFGSNIENPGIGATIMHYLSKLASEHKRYFWDHSIMSASILFLSTLIFMFKKLWNEHRGLILYTLLSLFFLALLGSSKSPRYLIFFLPFIVLITCYGINYLYQLKNSYKKGFSYFIGIMGIFQLVSTVLIANFCWQLAYDYQEKNNQMLSPIPKNSKILGPWELIFSTTGSYELNNYKTYEYLQERQQEPFTQKEVLNKAKGFEVEYIILTDHITRTKAFSAFKDNPTSSADYELFKKGEDFIILKQKQ